MKRMTKTLGLIFRRGRSVGCHSLRFWAKGNTEWKRLTTTRNETLAAHNSMETGSMSVPHSVVHARSYVGEVEKSPEKARKEGVKGVVSSSSSLQRQEKQ